MAWTVVETYTTKSLKLAGGEAIIRVKLVCTADASGYTETLSDELAALIKGSYLYGVWTIPGSGGDAPGAVYQIDVKDEDSLALLTLASRSTSATEFTLGSDTLGVFPPIMETFSIVFNDQIGNENKTTVVLLFLK